MVFTLGSPAGSSDNETLHALFYTQSLKSFLLLVTETYIGKGPGVSSAFAHGFPAVA